MVNRYPPYYLITGIVLGVVLGLLYAWVWLPVDQFNTHPNSFQQKYKDVYREVIAVAYISNGDLNRAKARLEILGDEDPARRLAVQARENLGDVGDTHQTRALNLLSGHLYADADGKPIVFATENQSVSSDLTGSPETTLTPNLSLQETLTLEATLASTITITALPSRTPTSTQAAAFELVSFNRVCNPAVQVPLIQIFTFDSANRGVSGVDVLVTWEGGQNQLFTGLKPEYGLGYADFEMTPGVVYDVRVANGGVPMKDLIAEECEIDGERYWVTWQVNFTQP